MNSLLTSDFFKENRAKLKSLFTGTAPIVLSANGLLQRNADNNYTFRQDSSFWYFTGIDEPDCILVIEKDKEYLILPQRPAFTDIASGKIDLKKISQQSGIDLILDTQNGWKQLGNKLKRARHVAILSAPSSYIEEIGFYTNPARASLIAKMKSLNPDITFLDLRPHITKLRSVKQPIEIEAIQSAINITNKAFKEVKRNINKLHYENEIEAIILSSFIRQGADVAFKSIIASGKNANIIHYQSNKSTLRKRDLIVIDIGAEFEHYAADISRTYSLSHPTKRQRQIFNGVIEVKNYALSLLKPGVDLKTYESKVEHFMGEQLRELGLIKSINKESVRKYYPHSTSHFLGLDPHDIGDYNQPLKQDMLITVEPGIYIQEEGIGIRIEEDVLITENGVDVLSKGLPCQLN